MRKCEKARDFNSGSVLSNILYFSLPYLLSYFLADPVWHGGSFYHRSV